MTDERIAEVRALCKAAAPGPWVSDYDGEQGYTVLGPSDGQTVWIGYEEDADFIAAARTALPEALDEIERLQRDLRSARVELEGLRTRVRSLLPEIDSMIAGIEVPS